MDFSQRKLSKHEWTYMEIPVSEEEQEILRLIQDGYHHVNIRYNAHTSLLTMLKMEYSVEMEAYLYHTYFEERCHQLAKQYQLSNTQDSWFSTTSLSTLQKIKKPKKIDIMRLSNLGRPEHIEMHRDTIFEFKLFDIAANVLVHPVQNIYTLYHLRQASIVRINQYVMIFIDYLLQHFLSIYATTLVRNVFIDAYHVIEKNQDLLKFQDRQLYDHQKQLFSMLRPNITSSHLVFYTAPTGTGKTISPLGLSCGYRIIFLCAARHVGIALAKSAISMKKAVAFAFGCHTTTDIRLHYYAASKYTINSKSGGIGRVDNSYGDKVDIMICDVHSYLIAMKYMLTFHPEENIIFYWDEPTISMDVEDHPLHSTIQRVWKENKISKVVLSCATLPKQELVSEVICAFRSKFHEQTTEITTISSYDVKKSVSLWNHQNQLVLPHLLFSSYEDLLTCVRTCQEERILLRYLDLQEIIRFFLFLEQTGFLPQEYALESRFTHLREITMLSIKLYYLEILTQFDPITWTQIHTSLKITNVNKLSSPGILLTTKDAHTLTDGPTIFIADDVEKLAQFFLQQSKIPSHVMTTIMQKITNNEIIQKKIEVLTKSLTDILGNEMEKEKKMEKDMLTKPEARKLQTTIDGLRAELSYITMEPMYIPNTRPHQMIWIPTKDIVTNAFVPWIEDTVVKEIMILEIEMQKKILLLLGIGVFTKPSEDIATIAYTEIMKKLAQEQRLFLIIASSDYIYGTNYQLCHAFLGKDLQDMTQQKIIQAMGRVGRGNIQQEYTIRVRNDILLQRLFLNNAENIEAKNMCKLFGEGENS